jgi:hypothetical protein
MGCVDSHVEASDEGRVCAYAAHPDEAKGKTQEFDAGQRVFFTVTYDECLSACIRNEVATCTVAREGSTLVVESDFAFDEPDGKQACIAVCYALDATCETDPLEAGSYRVDHGDDSYTFVVPSTAEPCF